MGETSKLLTLRQRIFVREVLLGKTGKEASQEAGYKSNYPRTLRCEVIKRAIDEALEKHGLSESYAAERLKELCEASNRLSDGTEVPNWNARAKGLHIYFSLKNAYQKQAQVSETSFEERLLMLTAPEEGQEAIDV